MKRPTRVSRLISHSSWYAVWIFTNTVGFLVGWVFGRAWGLTVGGNFYTFGNPVAGRLLFLVTCVTAIWVLQWVTVLQLSSPRLGTSVKLLVGLVGIVVLVLPLQAIVEAAQDQSTRNAVTVAGEVISHPPVQGLLVGFVTPFKSTHRFCGGGKRGGRCNRRVRCATGCFCDVPQPGVDVLPD